MAADLANNSAAGRDLSAMQSSVSARNYVVFLVTVFVMLVGWTYVRNKIWPPAPPKENIWALKDRPKEVQLEALARIVTPLGDRGLGDAVNLAAQALANPAVPQRPKPVEAPVVKKAEEPKAPAEEVMLGGSGFPFTARLSNEGAGVRELNFNSVHYFPAADRYGLPVKDAEGNPVPVTLLPQQAQPPAFAIYHYADADEGEKQPLDTLGRARWKIERKHTPAGARQEVVFSTELPEAGVKLLKTFTLAPNEFHLGLSIRIEPLNGAQPPKFRYQLAGARHLPIEGSWYTTTFRNALIGLVDNRDSIHRVSIDNATLSATSGSDRFRRDDKTIVYAAVALQFFTSAIVVDNLDANGQPIPKKDLKFLQFARATLEGVPEPTKPFFNDITVRAISEPLDLVATGPVEHRYLLYHGPVKVRQLSRLSGTDEVAPDLVERYAETLHLRTFTDYGSFGFLTDATIFFTNLIHRLVGFLTSFLPTGLAIIVVTIIVRGCMFPLSKRQAANMQKMQDKMAKLSPEMKEIEKKFKDDFLGKQQAQRELYRKHGVNPAAGLGGCLMLFVQMPIFMGLYYALQESVFFRLKPFLWIRNLTAPDMLAWWGEKIPWISDPAAQGSLFYLGPYLNLLPILAAVLIFVQQKLSMPKEMSDEQRQQYSVMKYMTIVMAVMFYKVPSGLSLYFICSSIWGLTERKLVKKSLAANAEAAKNAPPLAPKSKSTVSVKKSVEPPSRLRAWWENVLREAAKK